MWLIIAWLSPSLLPAGLRLFRYLVNSGVVPPWISAAINSTFPSHIIVGFGGITFASAIFIAWDMMESRGKKDEAEAIAVLAGGLFFVHVLFMLTIGLLLDAFVGRLIRY
jgi:hypothetical protein